MHLTTALIALGANLAAEGGQPPLETCRQAAARLGQLEGVRLAGLSRWFETAPVPPSDQARYINAVALLKVLPGQLIDPPLLLARLMAMEAAFGRQRSALNAPRTLDLDIISISGPEGDVVQDAPDLVLPHPRAHLRAFVLAPLADVAPDWVHPLTGKTAADMLAALPPQDIRPL